MTTMTDPDLRIDEALGRLGELIRDAQRRCISVLRDCISEVENGQPPNLHRYELALRAHHERAFAGIARNRITELAHMDLVETAENAAESYLMTHARGDESIEAKAVRVAVAVVVSAVTQAAQA